MTTTDSIRSSTVSTHPIWRTTAIAGALAAVATTAMGAIAKAADVPLVAGDIAIQLPAFAMFTLVGAAMGGLLAAQLEQRAARPRRSFLIATVVLTMVTFLPDVTADATTATKLTLVATHLVAAAIIVPALARRLSDAKR